MSYHKIMETEQFVTIPKMNLAETGLSANDLVTYAYLRRHYNSESKDCYPSIALLAQESGLTKNTLTESISKLEKAGYISVDRSKKYNRYTFSEFKKFDIYSFEFLDNKDLPTTVKAAILLLQPEAYINPDLGIAKISYSVTDLAKRLNIDVRTLRKYEKYLKETNPPIMTVATTKKRDPETGLMIQERILDIEKYFNLIICKLQQQDEAIKQNERDIKVLQNTVQSLQKQLEKYEKKAMADVILD